MKDTLNSRLEELKGDSLLPMHMPGHKRNPATFPEGISYSCDITEIDGFDNLHSPTGVIRNIENKAKELYGSEDAFISVNGASALLIASILSHSKRGDKILIASNCHISVWHAIEQGGLTPVILDPQTREEYPFAMRILPEDFEAKLKEEDIKLAIVTSPTYEGVISDTVSIHALCKERGVILIADEAHGAHFGIKGDNNFPSTSAADLVIKSVHKTLNAPTQTAVLLSYGSKVNKRLLRHFLSVFESTSPSYMLMAGLEKALYSSDVDALYKNALQLRAELLELKLLSLFTYEHIDISKIVILTKGAISGYELASVLREKFLIEVEAAFPDYIIAMTGTGDTPSSLARFAQALKAIDSTLTENPSYKKPRFEIPSFDRKFAVTIEEAVREKSSKVTYEAAAGEISAEYVFSYPPGVPLLIPGQEITEEIITLLKKAEENGVKLKADPYRTWDVTLLKVDTEAEIKV